MPLHQTFFTEQVPQILHRLQPNIKPLWGTMDATKMLDHLTAGTKLFLAQREIPLTIPEEKVPRYKAWLMTDANFKEGAPKPGLYSEFEGLARRDFEALKTAFLEVLKQFESATTSGSDFWTVHPSFGKLNAEETRQLQFKHIRHHFQQFGLLPRE